MCVQLRGMTACDSLCQVEQEDLLLVFCGLDVKRRTPFMLATQRIT